MNKFLKHRLMSSEEGGGGGGGGGGDSSWRDSLPDELKADPSLASVKDIPSLAKQFVDAQRHIGGSIRIPSEEAGKEDWEAFMNKITSKTDRVMPKPDSANPESFDAVLKAMGMPDNAEDYKVEGVDEADADLALFRSLAKDAKLTKSQFEGAFKKFRETQIQKRTESETRLKESIDSLKSEWGMAYDTRVSEAIDLMKKTSAPKALIEAAEAGKVDADTLKWAHGIVTAVGKENSNSLNDGKGDSSGKITPAEAKARIDEVMANKEHPYWNSRHPSHKTAVSAMVELHRAAGAGQN